MAMHRAEGTTARLARQLAEIEGVEPADAVELALKEALERRRERRPEQRTETPLQAARRLRATLGITLPSHARTPLPRTVFDELSGDL